MREFSREVCDRIGAYVYALFDDERVFYIGKGRGNRAFDHARGAVALEPGETEENAKLAHIRSMLPREPRVRLLRHGLDDRQAFIVESTLIDIATSKAIELPNGREDLRHPILNQIAGHHANQYGIMTAGEVVALYDPPEIELDDTPVLLVKIPRLWYRGVPEEALYEATRGWWQLNPKHAELAEYVFAVSKGVVREVYQVTPGSWRARRPDEPGWRPRELKRPRYGFEGEPAGREADKWRDRSVSGKVFPNRGPFRYHRCDPHLQRRRGKRPAERAAA